MFWDLALLILGFVILIKGADWLVSSSVSVARGYKVSELAVGLTIVAFGTSAPELVVNIISSMQKFSDVTLGNIVGSNLFNLMLILGISGVIYPITIKVKTVWKELPFSLIAAIILLVLANDSFLGKESDLIGRFDGIILLLFFVLFMVYIVVNMRAEEQSIESGYKSYKPMIAYIVVIIGIGALVGGSKLVVDNAVSLAKLLGASEKIIGVTIVSAGTSLPELVTSVVAAIRKKSDIAIGNVIGSNIFNIFLILGISATISPLPYNISFNFDVILLIVVTVLLFGFMFSGKKYKLDKWEAAFLASGYAGYMFYLLNN